LWSGKPRQRQADTTTTHNATRVTNGHTELTRRLFLGLGAAGLAGFTAASRPAAAAKLPRALADAVAKLE
jgi:hypothetical protein